uniref:G-protein coupled receptors family 1 profile domain-containing protein n=1 Tax=Meloidogyne incognita TaxID=6306 RepID=A0A914L3F8_MELIC
MKGTIVVTDPQKPSTNLSLCPEDVYSADQRSYRFYANAPISLFGIISNLMNIVVFMDMEMRQQLVNHFLLVLSISDLLLLICNFFFLVLPVVVVETDSFFWNDFFPYIIRYSYPLALTAQTSGVYLTVLVSFHRFLGVCHPFKAKRWVSLAPVESAIAGSILFSFAINIPTWLELGVVPCLSSRFNQISRQIQLAPFHNITYILIKKCIAYTILMFIVPFGVLITVNWKMVQALRFSSRMRQRSYSTNRQTNFRNIVKQLHLLRKSRHSEVFKTISKISYSSMLKPSSDLFKPKFSNSTRDRSITMMLLAIVALFLLCNGLAFLNSIIESIMLFASDESNKNVLPAPSLMDQPVNYLTSLNQNMSNDPHVTESSDIYTEIEEYLNQRMLKWFECSVEISNILITLNSSTSTLVYIIFSSKYRLIFKSLFGLSKRQKFNRVALTTAMAARRVVELSLIPEEVESRSRRKNTTAVTTAVTSTTALNEGSFKSAKYSTFERERFDSLSSKNSTLKLNNQLTSGYKRAAPSSKRPTVAAFSVRESQSSVQLSAFASIKTNQRGIDYHSRQRHFIEKDTPPVLYRSNRTLSRSLTNSESNLRLLDADEDEASSSTINNQKMKDF